jgi:hypothetical protein
VASHPYDRSGNPTTAYEVYDLATDGKLTQSGVTFQLGRMTQGEIVFTPDGKVGLTTQDDGSIGVFRMESSGAVHVVHTAFTGVAYATGLVMDPAGDRVYVLSTQWRAAGGGIFAARIGCDGTLTSEGLVAAAKLAAGLVLLPAAPRDSAQRAVVAATDVLNSTAGNNAHLLRWPQAPAKPKILTGTAGFPDDEAIVSAVAKTPDHRYVLVADNSEFSGIENRIAVVEVSGDRLRQAQLLSPLEDPVALVLSPFGNSGLVVSGYGNAIFHLSYDATSATTPFVNRGELPYVGIKPQLPATAVLIERGPLRGRVLVVETEGLRQVAFHSDGTLVDLGLTVLGHGLETMVGGLGIAP